MDAVEGRIGEGDAPGLFRVSFDAELDQLGAHLDLERNLVVRGFELKIDGVDQRHSVDGYHTMPRSQAKLVAE
jgi:hypothetical protein